MRVCTHVCTHTLAKADDGTHLSRIVIVTMASVHISVSLATGLPATTRRRKQCKCFSEEPKLWIAVGCKFDKSRESA